MIRTLEDEVAQLTATVAVHNDIARQHLAMIEDLSDRIKRLEQRLQIHWHRDAEDIAEQGGNHPEGGCSSDR